MSRLGFRFVHATCLCLDEPLAGTGLLSPEDRVLAEDATFRSWDAIVETCLAAQVEFLILTGNSFNARTNSLRARIALEKGFEKLAAHDISVFITPGDLDPISAWRKGIYLSPNVTLLTEEDQEPVAVMRDQRVLASIFVVATGRSSDARSGAADSGRHQTPFRIGLVPAGSPVLMHEGRPHPWPGASAVAASSVKAAMEQKTDFIAFGEGTPFTERAASGIIHDPGSAQALNGSVTGSRGCSVVDVSASGDVTIDPVAVAPIRWEEVTMLVDRHTNWNDLAEKMALAMMERYADSDEKLWIINWRLAGEGTVFESLADSAKQQELWTLLEGELAGETEVRRVHRLDRMTSRQPDPKAPAAEGTGLLHDFDQLLTKERDALLDRVQRELLELDWINQPDAKIVRETVQQLKKPAWMKRARGLAAPWLD